MLGGALPRKGHGEHKAPAGPAFSNRLTDPMGPTREGTRHNNTTGEEMRAQQSKTNEPAHKGTLRLVGPSAGVKYLCSLARAAQVGPQHRMLKPLARQLSWWAGASQEAWGAEKCGGQPSAEVGNRAQREADSPRPESGRTFALMRPRVPLVVGGPQGSKQGPKWGQKGPTQATEGRNEVCHGPRFAT